MTVVTWGAITRRVEEAADAAAGQGVGVDVVEARWLNPFDLDAVVASLRRTGRLMVVHEANVTGGFGGEVVAQVAESGVVLAAPPVRLGMPDLRIPAAPSLVGPRFPAPTSSSKQSSNSPPADLSRR